MIIWCDYINMDIKIGSNTIAKINNCKRFLIALKDISKLFSYFLFWILIIILFGLIFSAYRSISFIMGNYSDSWEYLCLSLAFSAFAITYLLMVWYLCSFSQLLASKGKIDFTPRYLIKIWRLRFLMSILCH